MDSKQQHPFDPYRQQQQNPYEQNQPFDPYSSQQDPYSQQSNQHFDPYQSSKGHLVSR